MKFYKCYSINLLRFIKSHNIRYMSKFINKTTTKTAWIFELTPELETILTRWTEMTSNK
jgi:hypothetical protein